MGGLDFSKMTVGGGEGGWEIFARNREEARNEEVGFVWEIVSKCLYLFQVKKITFTDQKVVDNCLCIVSRPICSMKKVFSR